MKFQSKSNFITKYLMPLRLATQIAPVLLNLQSAGSPTRTNILIWNLNVRAETSLGNFPDLME